MFPTTYNLEVLDELPATEIDLVDFVPSTTGPGDDLLVEVTATSGAWWLGRFHRPALSVRSALTAVCSTPDPARLCVVIGGDAVVVDADAPADHRWIDTHGPVTSVRAATIDGVLLLATPWTITALDVDGIRWNSDRIAIDGIRMDEIADGMLAGVADPDDVEPRDFAIVLRDGRVVGGTGSTNIA